MSFLREVPICSYFFWLGVEFDILFVSFFSSCSKKTKQNVIDEVLGRKPTSNFSTLALWAFFSSTFFLIDDLIPLGVLLIAKKEREMSFATKPRKKNMCAVNNDNINDIDIYGNKIKTAVKVTNMFWYLCNP